jgi:integrase
MQRPEPAVPAETLTIGLPHPGKLERRAIRTVAVEQMGCVFNHAMQWEFTDHNPIAGAGKGSSVRVSAKRERTPDILEVEEMHLLLAALGTREKAMVFLDMPSGLRRGELAGLKWEDFDFKNLHVSVTRSLVDQHVGPVRTEASRKLMPIDDYVAHDLLAWYEVTPYKKPSDYVWATDANGAGANNNPKVVQGLLRHASYSITMNVYDEAMSEEKRSAHRGVIQQLNRSVTRSGPKPAIPQVVDEVGVPDGI